MNTSSQAIRKCVHYINIHLHEKLEIADIAKKVGLSRDYLSALFKKEFGVSLHSYIIHEKLEASKLMLKQGITYNAISYNLSFCSQSHFVSCFKKEYGMTPKQYKDLNDV